MFATNRPGCGQDCDGIDETKPVSSHDIIRWLRKAPSSTPDDESLARHEAGQFLSQTGAAGHLPSILAANSAVSFPLYEFAVMRSYDAVSIVRPGGSGGRTRRASLWSYRLRGGSRRLAVVASRVRDATAGCLAWYRGDEELRVANTGNAEMTMLAFLAPKFGTS